MLFFHGVLTVFLIGIFFYDLTRYIIPNWMSGVVIALWPAMLFMTNDWQGELVIWQSLLVAAVVFIVGIGIFIMRWAGGGDVKLMAALALWTGTAATLEFVVYTGLLGGLLVFACLLLRPLAGRLVPAEKADKLPRVLRHKEPVPYGIAITLAFLALLWTGSVPGLPVPFWE